MDMNVRDNYACIIIIIIIINIMRAYVVTESDAGDA